MYAHARGLLFLMSRRPPRSTRTDTLFPSTTLFRSHLQARHGFGADFVQDFLDLPDAGHPFRIGGVDHMQQQFGVACLFQRRSEEHTSELQSLMRTSYAVFCLKKKRTHSTRPHYTMYNTNSKDLNTKT